MGMSSGGGRGSMSDINITPLVDVMLVLLIIFMVTAPLIVQGVEVKLPEARAQSLEHDEQRIILAIDKDKRIFIGEIEVPIEELEVKLGTNAKLQRDKELYLHADRALPYGVVVEVMAIARRSGVETLGMVTDPMEPK